MKPPPNQPLTAFEHRQAMRLIDWEFKRLNQRLDVITRKLKRLQPKPQPGREAARLIVRAYPPTSET